MNSPRTWEVLKGSKGFTLRRPRANIFNVTVSIQVSNEDAAQWRVALQKIMLRLRSSARHSLPLSVPLRGMTGCWARDVSRIRYLGSLPFRNGHIVSVRDRLYLLLSRGDRACYPISPDDLKHVLGCLS